MLVTVNKTFTIRVSVEVVPTDEVEAQSEPQKMAPEPHLLSQAVDQNRILCNKVDSTVENIQVLSSQGMSRRAIAKRCGCHVSTIYARLKSAPVNDRFKSIREHMRPNRFRRFMHILKQKSEGRTIAEIASAEKCSSAAIVDTTKNGRELAKKFKIDLNGGLSIVDDKPAQLFTLGNAKV